jgi:hypothetical protein
MCVFTTNIAGTTNNLPRHILAAMRHLHTCIYTAYIYPSAAHSKLPYEVAFVYKNGVSFCYETVPCILTSFLLLLIVGSRMSLLKVSHPSKQTHRLYTCFTSS